MLPIRGSIVINGREGFIRLRVDDGEPEGENVQQHVVPPTSVDIIRRYTDGEIVVHPSRLPLQLRVVSSMIAHAQMAESLHQDQCRNAALVRDPSR